MLTRIVDLPTILTAVSLFGIAGGAVYVFTKVIKRG
jgi:hypothetical protein